MELEDLGYSKELENNRVKQNLSGLDVGRVISEHKDRYVVKTSEKEFFGEILGNLRYTATKRSDFPAVGDWVAISEYDDDKVVIHAVIQRRNALERQAIGKQGDKQLIAANIDYAFIVQAVNRDFSINRVERYLTICYNSNVQPIVVLNKIDLVDSPELARLIEKIESRIPQVPIFTLSNETLEGLDKIQNSIQNGKTYCLLGSSGVGKSTLLNKLAGKTIMNTKAISSAINRGKHVTTHRELIVLENGGILIDNPGMREVGITDTVKGLETTFESILELAEECKFNDCTHTNEKGCAILLALEEGELNHESYENFLKLEREKTHFESSVAERRKKEKAFSKMVNQVVRKKKV